MLFSRLKNLATHPNEECFNQVNQGLNHPTFVLEALPADEFCLVKVNSAYEKLTGLENAKIQGKTLNQIFSAETVSEILGKFQQCIQSKSSISYEESVPLEGKDSWWNTTLIYFENPLSGHGNIIGTSINITERKLEEDKLRQSAATKQAILNALPDMLFRHSPDGTYLELVSSGEWEPLLPPSEVLGQRVVDVLPPDIAQKVMNGIDRALATHQVQTFDYQRLIDQEFRYYEARIAAIDDREVLSIVRDISDRQRAQNAFDRSQNRLITALKNSQTSVFQQNKELRYTWVYNYHNIDDKAVLGKTDLELLPAKYARPLMKLKQRVLDTEISAREEVKVSIQGKVNFYDLTVDPLYDGSKNLIGITCAAMQITERKQSEIALKEAYERLRLHLDNTPLGVIEWNREYQVQHWSKSAEKIFGWSAAEVTGKSFTQWRFVHQEDISLVARKITDLVKKGGQGNVIGNRNYTKDGSCLYCEWHNSVLRDESGKMVSILSFVQDVTDRQQAKAQIQEAYTQIEFQNQTLEIQVEERIAQLRRLNQQLQQEVIERTQAQSLIQKIADTIPQLLYIYDVIKQCNVYANDRHREFYGCTQAEIESQGSQFFRERTHPDDFGKFAELQERFATAKDGEILENEFRIKNAQGEWRWLHTWNVLLSKTAEGLPEQILGTGIDITDRRQAEQQLQFQAQLLNNVRDSIIATDLDGRIIYWSPGSQFLYGYTPEEVLGKPVSLIVEPQEIPREEQRMRQVLKTGYWAGQYWQKRRDASSFWANTTLSLATDQTGQPFAVIGVDRDLTAIKQAQEQLYRREQEFKALGENSPDIIARFDRQLRHIYVNPAVELATGMPPEKFIGKTNAELAMPPELVRIWDRAIGHVFETGQGEFIEFEMLTPTGEKTYQAHIVPEYARDGSVEFALGVTREITELKWVKKELQTSRDFLDAVLETANEGILVRNDRGKLVIYNHQMEEITGYSKEEAQHPDYLKWIYPDPIYLQKALAWRKAALRGEKFQNEDWQITCKDGSKRTALISVKLLNYAQHQWIISTWRDITDRTVAREALRQSEERYRVLVETIPYGIREIDLAGRITFSNSACMQMLGYPFEELRGKCIWEFMDSEEKQAELREYIAFRLAEEPAPTAYHTQYRKKDGTIIDVEVAWNYKRNELGQVIGFVSVLTDITARTQAQKKLQASLHEKELLLKEVHHRVKNNLQVISSIFSLQSQYIQNPQILSILTESQNRIASMALIHEKLYQSDSLAQVDFAKYIQSLARNLFDSYNISANLICLNLQVNHISLNLDTAIVCGLLINELISNSLKHAFPTSELGDPGETIGQITIVFSQVSEGILYLEVKDNGVGLPIDLDLAQTNSLGLRLVSALTRQLRGKLNIHNDDGAVFQLTFPQPQNHRRF